MKISKSELDRITKDSSWASQGDSIEKKRGYLINDTFPHLEEFWSSFVVPSTGRIHKEADFIRQPKYIDPRMVIIGNHNYMVFRHLVKCHQLMQSRDDFVVEDFYVHLVAVLDNFESLVGKLMILFSDFDDSYTPEFLTKLTKKQFIEQVEEFYDKSYATLYEYYKQKSSIPFRLKHIKNRSLLIQFFDESFLKEYINFSGGTRHMRNLIHGICVGRGVLPDGDYLIPREKVLHKYKNDFRKVFEVLDKGDIKDLVKASEQMKSDFEDIQKILNKLYEQILTNLEHMQTERFYKKLYGLEMEVEEREGCDE